MAGLKEINRRVKSVKSTKKITYAMKLVSAAKLRKAQESVVRSRQYTEALNGLLNQLSQEQGDGSFSHPLMERRATVKNVRILVVGGNRGLCGGYNTNINKKLMAVIREKSAEGASVTSTLVGRKPAEFYRRNGIDYVESFEVLPDNPNLWKLDDLCLKLETEFLKGDIDEVQLIYTRFKSALSQTATCTQILPMTSDALPSAKHSPTSVGGDSVTLFEPSASEVFKGLMPRILRSKVLQAALESKASEQGARMTAMDAATKNAGDLIDSLTLKRNKLRQGGITSELLDIVGGSEALK